MAKQKPLNTHSTGSQNGALGWRHRRLEIAVALAATAFSAAGFIVLDYAYTRYTLKGSFQRLAARRARAARQSHTVANCRVRDSVMEHAFRPNCATIERWGADTYEV